MADEIKPFWKSKTIISDIVTALVGVYAVLVPILATHGINLPPMDGPVLGTILSVLAALGIYGRVTASTTISPK